MGRRPAVGSVILLLAASCVSTVAEPDDRAGVPIELPSAVVIPIGGAQGPLDEFWRGVVDLLRQAYDDRDLSTVRNLLATWRPDLAPEWARDSLRSFGDAALGLEFELHLRARAVLQGPEQAPALGAPVQLQLRIPPLPSGPIELGTGAGKVHFHVTVSYRDQFTDGSWLRQEAEQIVAVERGRELGGVDGVTLPIEIGAAAGSAVRREVTAAVALVPGTIARQGRTSPVRGTPIGRTALLCLPAGVEHIAQKPLLSMREAMRLGDAAHFPHVFLAALLMPAEQRDAAAELLVQWVRLGRLDQLEVATAALRELYGVDLPVGDRERWLAWWQSRR